MEQLIAPIPVESEKHASSTDNSTNKIKRPAPSSGGCRIEGFVRVKKVKLIVHLVESMHWSHVWWLASLGCRHLDHLYLTDFKCLVCWPVLRWHLVIFNFNLFPYRSLAALSSQLVQEPILLILQKWTCHMSYHICHLVGRFPLEWWAMQRGWYLILVEATTDWMAEHLLISTI